MDKPRRRRPSMHRSDAEAPDTRHVASLESQLRNLPELEAPGELWERIRGRLDEVAEVGAADDEGGARSPSPWRRHRQMPMAAAASAALVALAAVLVTVNLSTDPVVGSEGPDTARHDAGRVHPIADIEPQPETAPSFDQAIIDALLKQSRQAEQRRRAVLAFYSPSAPERLIRAHIGGIDAALNEQMFAGEIEPKSREALLRDRVDLMADLTDIERFRQHEFVRQVSF